LSDEYELKVCKEKGKLWAFHRKILTPEWTIYEITSKIKKSLVENFMKIHIKGCWEKERNIHIFQTTIEEKIVRILEGILVPIRLNRKEYLDLMRKINNLDELYEALLPRLLAYRLGR
jgi:uncharacterized protein YllA (UPF0747 family)